MNLSFQTLSLNHATMATKLKRSPTTKSICSANTAAWTSLALKPHVGPQLTWGPRSSSCYTPLSMAATCSVWSKHRKSTVAGSGMHQTLGPFREIGPKHRHVSHTWPCPMLSCHPTWLDDFLFPSSIYSGSSDLQTPSLVASQTKALQTQFRALQFPAKKERANHDQHQEDCSAGQEVAADGSVGEKADLLGGGKGRWWLLHLRGQQGPLRGVHCRQEEVRGSTGIPQHTGICRAPADIPGGVWLREQWADHTSLWCCSNGVCHVPAWERFLCRVGEGILEYHGSNIPLHKLCSTVCRN